MLHKQANVAVFLLGAVFISSVIATFIIHRSPSVLERQKKINMRSQRLLQKASKEVVPDFKPQDSSRYSAIVYDFEIKESFSGSLPWAKAVASDPSNVFSFTWRIKLLSNSSLSFQIEKRIKANYMITIKRRNGRLLYTKSKHIAIPKEEIVLDPDIYIVTVVSNKQLDFIKLNVNPKTKVSTKFNSGNNPIIKTIHLQIDKPAEKGLKRLVVIAKNSSPVNLISKMPKGRVKAKFTAEDGTAMAARIGLSGRTKEHLYGFPSLDVKIKKTRAFMGFTSFKLYRMETKSGLFDFVLAIIIVRHPR